MNNQLWESIGLYQQWKDAQNAPESGDMFDDTLEAIKTINETLNDIDSDNYGRIGRTDYKTSIGLIIPDSVDSSDKEAVNKYLNSISELFTYDENGDRAGLNIEAFCKKAAEKGLMTLDEATGDYIMSGEHTMEEFAEGLGLSLPLVQAMFGEIQEFLPEEIEWKTNFESKEEELVSVTEKAEELQDQIKDLGDENTDINVDDSELTALNVELEQVLARKRELEEEIKIETDSYESEQGEGNLTANEASKKLFVKLFGKEDVESALKEIDETEIKDKSVNVGLEGKQEFLNDLDEIMTALIAMPSQKTIKVNVTEGTDSSGGGSSSGKGESGKDFAYGTARANGYSGYNSSGKALVGELGNELICLPREGRFYTVALHI